MLLNIDNLKKNLDYKNITIQDYYQINKLRSFKS